MKSIRLFATEWPMSCGLTCLGHATTSQVRSSVLAYLQSRAKVSRSRVGLTQSKDLFGSGHLRCSSPGACCRRACVELSHTNSTPAGPSYGPWLGSWGTHSWLSFYWSSGSGTLIEKSWIGPWTDWRREESKCRFSSCRAHLPRLSPDQSPTRAPSPTQ